MEIKERVLTPDERIKEYEERIERDKLDIKALKEEIAALEKYNKYRDAADEARAIHQAFVDAGFTDDQAFTLINTSLAATIKAQLSFK